MAPIRTCMVLLLSSTILVGQDFLVSVMVRNPAPSALETWLQDKTIVQVSLTNRGSASRTVILGIELTNRTMGRSIRTNNDHSCMPRFTLAPGETQVLYGPDIMCRRALTIPDDIQRSVQLTGAIPEGEYEYCVTVLDATDRRTELATTGVRCARTHVIWPEPPVRIRPLSGDAAQRCDQPILLQWQPLTPAPPGGVRYRVRAVGMFDGQQPRQALETATRSETIVEETTAGTSYTIALNNPVLLDLVRRTAPRFTGIAWQVEARDMNERPIATRGGTGGKSDIGTFGVTCPGTESPASCTGAMTLQVYYPRHNDTIPWLPPHLIVQWGPYCTDVIRMQYTLRVRSEESTVGTNARTLEWPRGPIAGQGLSGYANAEERARLIITNQWDNEGNFVRWNNSLRRGTTYTWSVDATLTRREGRSENAYTVTTGERSFNLGLRMPTDPSPAHNATVPSGSSVTLSWTIPQPNQLHYDPPDLLTLRSDGSSGMMFGAAAEFIRVVVARDSAFRTLVASQSWTIPPTGNYVTNDATARDLFGRKNARSLNLSDGTYYWRVEYASPTDTSTPYRRGPTWRFQIGAAVAASECIRLRPNIPEHRATVTSPSDGRIQFSIVAEPPINLAAIQRCQLRIWQMNNPSEDRATVRSRPPQFDVTVSRAGGSIPLREISRSGSEVRIALEMINTSSATHTFAAVNGQTYLWECILDFDTATIRSDGTRCTADPPQKSCEGIFTFRRGECNDPCEVSPPSNRTSLSGTLRSGEKIRIGNFEAILSSVSGSNDNLSGEAEVIIPWLNNIRVRTSFSGIAVNTERQVYSGELAAVQAAESGLDAELANRLSGGLGLTREQLNAINDFINTQRRLLSMMSGAEPVTMPIGFDRTIDGFRIAVGIIGMVFQPTGARLNAVYVQPLPWLGPGQSLGFGVRNICFSPNGLGSSFDIYLASDLGYRAADTSWAFNFKAPQPERGGLPADSGTYVRISCGGFEFLRIAAEVEFPRTWMVPAPDDGRNVRLRFTTRIRGTGDFIASTSMSPFSPAGAPGFVMRCENVTVDLSDRDNPEGISFPSGYSGATDNTWRGFYIGRLFLQFPEGIRGWRSSGPPQVAINHLLIDRTGISLEAIATNILRHPEANLGGWGGSIDTLGLILRQNSLQRGWMSGQILVPVSDSALQYSAIIRDTARGIRFEFTVQPRGELNIPLWAASVRLDPTSRVRLEAGAGGGFVARANFDGQISFGGTREIPLNLGGIRFQNMQIRTDREPYINVGTWSFASPPHSILGPPEPEPLPPDGSGSASRSAGGFPINIRQFNLVSGARREGPGVGVRISVSVNLQPGRNAISGETTISVWGAFQSSSDGPPRFVFSGIDLDSIGIRADLGSVEISGSVRFYNNAPAYGNGFRGAVSANFVRMVRVDATVQFGSISSPQSYRYWYVDARAIIARGIPVFSGVGIYGFGGGAWYNMRRESEPTSVTPTGSDVRETSASRGAPGTTNSGARYVPSYSSSGETFGFYALVTLGTHPEPRAFNCDVRMEISFVGGGIHEIRLRGNGWIMAGVTERSRARVTCTADISYNFPTSTFHGDFGVTASIEAARATGRMVIHFDPSEWYVKIGDPLGERVTVRVLNIVDLQAYFMTGNRLPPLPELPEEITRRFGGSISRMSPTNTDASRSGGGFMFGARGDFRWRDTLRFLIFYADLRRVVIGFDMALVNLGPDARCAEVPTSPVGLDGWYANGQVYAAVDAAVYLDVNLAEVIKGRFEILSLQAAAALQAGTPNPTWLAGAVGGDYSILGGAIRGHCDFRFTLGERCTPPVMSPLASLDLISDIAPRDGETNVSLFAEPTAFFNFEPDRPFALEAMRSDGSTETKVYRIRVGRFQLFRDRTLVATAGPVVRSTREAPARAIIPTEPLQGLTQYRVEVTAYGQEYTGRSFQRRPGETIEQASQRAAGELASVLNWQDVRRSGGGRVEQQVTATFTTQARPDTVPPEWVYIAYPRPRQRFFLQDECRDGSITLLVNQNWIFPSSGSQRRVGDTIQLFRARFINLETGERTEVPLTYQRTPRPYAIGERNRTTTVWGGQINFPIPRLANEKIYAVQIIRRDSVEPRVSRGSSPLATGYTGVTRVSGPLASRVQSLVRARLYELGGSTLEIHQRYRPSGFDVGRVVASNEKLLYVYFFRTSRYNRMVEKARASTTNRTEDIPCLGEGKMIEISIESPEGYDPHDVEDQEITSSATGRELTYVIPSLIQFDGTARHNTWHYGVVNPLYEELGWLADASRGNFAPRWSWNWTLKVSSGMILEKGASHTVLARGEIANAVPRHSSDLIFVNMADWDILSPALQSLRPATTTMTYAQPDVVARDFSLARGQAVAAHCWCTCGLGAPRCPQPDINRLRSLSGRAYVRPYHERYRIVWRYPNCSVDNVPSYNFEFYYPTQIMYIRPR